MSLYPRSKRSPVHHNHIHIHPIDLPHEDEANMQIPAMIIVPRRNCRVTSTMQQQPNIGSGRSGSPSSAAGSSEGRKSSSSSSKPWQVDMARKTSSTRRFRRPSRLRRTNPVLSEPTAAPSAPCYYSPNNSLANDISGEDVAPELDGSWNKLIDIDDGYPSDEENGFGRAGRSSSNSPSSPGDYNFRGYERYVSSRASRYQRA